VRFHPGPARRRRVTTGAVAAAVVLFCGVAVLAATASPAHAFNQEVTRKAKVTRLKAFAKRFGTAPQLLVLGSSRSMRADPAQLRKALGVKGFNAAVSSGTITDAYAFFSYTKRRYPAAKPAVLWFLDVEVFRLSGYQPYLLSVSELVKCLPAGGPGGAPRPHSLPASLAMGGVNGGRTVAPRFHADGLMTFWWHDVQRAAGRGTMAGVRFNQGTYGAIYARHGWKGLTGSAKWFTARIIKEANEMGVTPVIVMTPYHPVLRRHLAALGWTRAYKQVRGFLRQLKKRYELRVVDLTSLRSFGGWANGFYDGVHPRPPMMRAMLNRVVKRAGAYLKPGSPAPSPAARAEDTRAAAASASTADVATSKEPTSPPDTPATSPSATATLPPIELGLAEQFIVEEHAAGSREAGGPIPSPPALSPDAGAAAVPGVAASQPDVPLGPPSALPCAWPTPPALPI
jgi:hypothetical protein